MVGSEYYDNREPTFMDVNDMVEDDIMPSVRDFGWDLKNAADVEWKVPKGDPLLDELVPAQKIADQKIVRHHLAETFAQT